MGKQTRPDWQLSSFQHSELHVPGGLPAQLKRRKVETTRTIVFEIPTAEIFLIVFMTRCFLYGHFAIETPLSILLGRERCSELNTK